MSTKELGRVERLLDNGRSIRAALQEATDDLKKALDDFEHDEEEASDGRE